jgi:hypothetical protein
MDWILLSHQDRDQRGTVVNTVMNLWVTQKACNSLASLAISLLFLKNESVP